MVITYPNGNNDTLDLLISSFKMRSIILKARAYQIWSKSTTSFIINSVSLLLWFRERKPVTTHKRWC